MNRVSPSMERVREILPDLGLILGARGAFGLASMAHVLSCRLMMRISSLFRARVGGEDAGDGDAEVPAAVARASGPRKPASAVSAASTASEGDVEGLAAERRQGVPFTPS